jgi:ornithine cyclodeaminase/alanine dehydrogenase-like protein (mu-crystallin family)
MRIASVMPLFLSEDDVGALLTPAAALPVVEACFRRLAGGVIENLPRTRLAVPGGSLALMAATDTELGVAGLKSYTVVEGKAAFVVCLFSLEDGSLLAVIEADRLGQLRTGAATGVAARHLAHARADSAGLIGCGWQAESQLAAVRAALPSLRRAVVWCRRPDRLAAFCASQGAEPAESAQAAGSCDVVVTVTSATDPVLRGDWLRPGALVCAVGANRPGARELDSAVIARATFVCCDSLAQARLESSDLIDPVAAGALDWLEVHELQEVVVGETPGREHDTDIVLFKSNGIAAWDVAIAHEAVRLAREQGIGREL